MLKQEKWMFKLMIDKKGETILEVIVAIGVMAAVFATITTAIIRVSNVGYSTKNREQAIKIAQQTIEKIYVIRDTDRCNFYSNVSDCPSFTTKIINQHNRLENYTAGGGWADISQLFEAEGGTSAIDPKRKIEFCNKNISGIPAKEITVTIKWSTKGIPHDQVYSLRKIITDWRSL